MRLFPERRSNTVQVAMIVAAGLVSFVIGASYLFYESPYSPLLVAGLVLGLIFSFLWVKRPVLALYAAVLVVFLPSGLLSDSIQSNLNRLLTVVALAVWGVSLILHRRKIIFTGSALLMVTFLVWSLFTVMWANNLVIAKYVLGGFILRLILFLFLIPNEINTRETLDGLMHTLAIAAWATILAGISTILSQGYVVGTRLKIMEANENTFGGQFPIFLVAVLWLAIRPSISYRKLWLSLSLAFIPLSFVLIALSGSRGGAITWVICILGMLVMRHTRLWGKVGLLILIASAVVAPFVLSTTIDRFIDTTDNDTLLGGREQLWRAGWQLIGDYPLTGVGVGNARYAMVDYLTMYISTVGEEDVPIHNPILTIWAETGIPGIILYLGVLISVLGSFGKQYIRCKNQDVQWLMPYFALTAPAFLGYMASWVKGGGIELSHSYFLMLALLLIPANLNVLDSTPVSSITSGKAV